MSERKHVACVAVWVAACALIATCALSSAEKSSQAASLPIDIDAKDVSVSEVLRMLGKAAGVNIIVGQDVKGTVDAISLHDITVEDALRLIAEAQGLYWYKDASNTYVVTGVPPRRLQTATSSAPAPSTSSAPAQPTVVPPVQPTSAAPTQPAPAVAQPQPSEPAIPVPPISPGTSTVTTKTKDRSKLMQTALIRLNYISAAEVADMLGGRIVWGASGGSLDLPTPASARRRAYGAASAVAAEASVLGGLGGGRRTLASWRQFPGPGGVGGAYGGRGGRYGGIAGGAYGGGYGRAGYGGYGGYGRTGFGRGGYGGAGAMLLPSEMMEIVAYMPQNALLVRGLPEEIDQLKDVISWLDQPAKQVEISCKFVSITVTAEKSLGIDWRVTNGQLEFWNLGFAPGEAVNNVIRFARGRFEATLGAALSSGRATILAKPIVTTQNNMPAEINFYTEIPYFIAIVTYNEFGQRQVDFETEYAYINNMLSVTPRINADDTVTMEVYPEIDQQVGTVEGPNGEQIPITSNWYIYVPQVRVADGETLVIGGIISKSENENVRKTPLLCEIPLIGNLFKARRRTINNTETLIFITPRIVREIPRD